MGKYINVGIGVSTKKDGYQAAKEASEEALKECDKKPTFSIVFCSSNYSPEKVAKGITKKIGDTDWVGTSTDAEITGKYGFSKDSVTVLCISTEHIHFGVGYVENYLDDPSKAGGEAIRKAMDSVKIDRYVDPYVQYTRMKTKKFKDIVSAPPYFILTFMSGAEIIKGKPITGAETSFLQGIISTIGQFIPIFGASASVDFDKYMKGFGRNFEFVNGKVLRSGAVVVFASSNLHFSYSVQHGYLPSKKVAVLSELDSNGHTIRKINGREAVSEYAKLLGLTKKELLKDPFKYTLAHPLGIKDLSGKIYIKEAVPNPDNKTMYSLCKLDDNIPIYIMDYNEKKTLSALVDVISYSDTPGDPKKIALALLFDCSGRKAILKGGVKKEIKLVTSKYPKVPTCGFYSFAEIGSVSGDKVHVNNQTATGMIIYDQLLTD